MIELINSLLGTNIKYDKPGDYVLVFVYAAMISFAANATMHILSSLF